MRAEEARRLSPVGGLLPFITLRRFQHPEAAHPAQRPARIAGIIDFQPAGVAGVETESAYKAGLSFKNDVAAAQAQDSRHWTIEASLPHGAASDIIITARDAQGHALAGLTPEVRLAHPTDKRRDVILEVVELTPGRFKSLTPAPEGLWDLVIDLKRETKTVFRSKSRVTL